MIAQKQKAGPIRGTGLSYLFRYFVTEIIVGLSGCRLKLSCKHSFKALFFVLIVQHYDGHNAHGALAAAAHGYFALQILQEAVSETIQ